VLMLKHHGSPCERRNAERPLTSKLATERDAMERLVVADKFTTELSHTEKVADCGQQKAAERAESVETSAISIQAPYYSLLRLRATGREAEEKITERPAVDWESAGRMEETLTAVPMAVERVSIDDTSSDQEIDGREVDHKDAERVDAKQGVGYGGAERVFCEHDFDKVSAKRCNVKMTGHKIVEHVSVSRMNEEANEYYNRRDGRKSDGRVVWFVPKAVRWRVEGLCTRRVNWKSVRWRMVKRRVSCKLVRWREEHWNEPSESGSGIGGVELIEDDQHCRMADCYGR
jgi:hypothetical protein